MAEYLNLKIHHNGEFVDDEMSVYEGGQVAELKIDVDRWSYFELLGCFKDLRYNLIEKVYYRDPTFRMNLLVNDKCALEITYLYRVHLNVDIYIQHTLSQPDYYDGPVDEIVVEQNEIVDETEQVIAAMYEEAVNGGLKETELMEGDGSGKNGARENDVMENDVLENVVRENVISENAVMETDGNVNNEQGGSEVNDVFSSDDSEDESFIYDSAMKVAFDD
ncbi:unnamed protein product [Lathyrus sativus]|nr:unnamed protein product [Lathyrus sativus]